MTVWTVVIQYDHLVGQWFTSSTVTTGVVFLKVVFERPGLGQAPLPCLASVISRQSVIAVLACVTDVAVSARFHLFKCRNRLLDLAVSANAGARDLIPRDKRRW